MSVKWGLFMVKFVKLQTQSEYKTFLQEIKERIKSARLHAVLAVNQELIKFYWETGKAILVKQKTKKWGSKFLDQLSYDLRNEFHEMQGFSKRNLENMRGFASLYPKLEFAKQAVSQLPWGHIVRLIQTIKDNQEREWYAQQTIKNGWSRAVMEMQVESDLYHRQSLNDQKITNYLQHLPKSQSDLAQNMLKDPYKFDFLTIQGKAREREIEAALIAHIRDFLLELGQGFAFVGSQIPLTFDEQEFFIDLLFYHLTLRCYVVIEIKTTKFKPEHTGQLGFYLAAVDDQLKKKHDNRTIGILLCKSKNKIIAEYALRNISAPIGLSEYSISKSLPKELKTNLPSIEEIEAELNDIGARSLSRKRDK